MAENYFQEIGAFNNISTALTVGAPGPDLLIHSNEVLKKATTHRLSQPDACQLLQYGLTRGDGKFPVEVAKFLSRHYGDPVSSEDIHANAGATQGAVALAGLLLKSGDFVFVEEPTYFLALSMLREDMHLNIVPIPTDNEGIQIDTLEESLKIHKAKSNHVVSEAQPFWSIIYLIPTFNNPKGFCVSPERSKQIVSVARKYGCLVLCDDVYNVLSYRSDDPDKFVPAPKRLFAYDDKSDPDYQGNVISNATFSKFFGPGLRLGWYEAPKRVLKILYGSGYIQSGGGFNSYTCGIVTSALETGLLDEILVKFRRQFHLRRDAIYNAAKQYMPEGVKFNKPQGGYFMWVELPEHINAQDVLKISKQEHKIAFALGTKFSSTGRFQNYLRFSFSYYDEAALTEAMKAVAAIIKRLM
ncbi:uncharacterized protein TRIADDRAFT_53439 [Trichoplax adhaerens]|uniref:Aminotransferase class I/classII large domain-containing protein n=1 Tax=Trichoplax adhaerens TaxID=10228 RepID=B3RP84_TRIAD|nr:hypothetical protein TRIADDRAFT_53439 [Trichoplax adhaerens]EDV28145.1 hypothetical protein TRIADDRAFT_53439 [Trichoplax adhaerens]|eukprot:XP_002109979.1 hypothetical protein TRIADDRAFT_53439 [Trichoplax adhaerens]